MARHLLACASCLGFGIYRLIIGDISIYAACVEAGVPFCTQIGHTGPLKRSECGQWPIPDLEKTRRWISPSLSSSAVMSAFHGPRRARYAHGEVSQFLCHTSAYALHRLPPVFVNWMKGMGRDRVMFGTNWPMSSCQVPRGIERAGIVSRAIRSISLRQRAPRFAL